MQWILTDRSDRLWLGYSTGVACLSKFELDRAAEDSSYRVAFQFFDDADGLKGNPDRRSQSATVRDRDGTLRFRTSEGVAIVDPQHMTKNLIAPPVHIERLLTDGAAVGNLQAVRLLRACVGRGHANRNLAWATFCRVQGLAFRLGSLDFVPAKSAAFAPFKLRFALVGTQEAHGLHHSKK